MKEHYDELQAEVISFEPVDVITASKDIETPEEGTSGHSINGFSLF